MEPKERLIRTNMVEQQREQSVTREVVPRIGQDIQEGDLSLFAMD